MSIILDALKKAERERVTPEGKEGRSPIPSLLLREPGKGSSLPLVAIVAVILVVVLAAGLLFVAPIGKKWIASFRSQRLKPASVSEQAPTPPPANASLLPKGDPFGVRNRALELFNRGDFAGSLTLWQELIASIPGDFEAINNLGVVLKKLDRPGEALAAYERAIATNPQYPFAQNNAGVLLMEQGKLAKAQDHLERAMALDSTYADPHLHLAILFEKQKKKGDAAQHFRTFLTLSPLLAPDLKDKITSRLARLDFEP